MGLCYLERMKYNKTLSIVTDVFSESGAVRESVVAKSNIVWD
jgi:hypothetical protein